MLAHVFTPSGETETMLLLEDHRSSIDRLKALVGGLVKRSIADAISYSAPTQKSVRTKSIRLPRSWRTKQSQSSVLTTWPEQWYLSRKAHSTHNLAVATAFCPFLPVAPVDNEWEYPRRLVTALARDEQLQSYKRSNVRPRASRRRTALS